MKRVVLAALVVCVVAGACIAAENPQPITPKKKVPLLSGKDFAGWKLFLPGKEVDPKTVWSVKDGVVHCKGRPAGYMRTESDYTNYKLHVEWRWAGRPGNSGVLLHMSGQDKVWPKSIECQLMNNNAGDVFIIGGTMVNEMKGKRGRRVPKKAKSSEKPKGEWNTYEIVCQGDTIRAKVNGVLQTHVTGSSDTAGKICLQSEGAPIEFRNVYIEPLKAPGGKIGKDLDFTLADQNGKKMSLSDFADKIVVLEWMNEGCPIWTRVFRAGIFNKLVEKYEDKGVVWLSINSSHFASVEHNKKTAEALKMPYPVLDDRAGVVGRRYGAKTTPHMYIIKDGKIVYKGAIDDAPRGRKPNPTNYVDKALAELLAGKAVSVPETKAYGCTVKYGRPK